MCGRVIGIGMLAVLFAFAVPTYGAVVAVSGQGDILDPLLTPTGALSNFFDDTGDNVKIHAWNERQYATLTDDIRVDITTPGTYRKVFVSENAWLTKGTVVSSHLIILDPLHYASAEATFTFAQKIIGIIVESDLPQSKGGDRFLQTDYLGNPLTIYPTSHFWFRGVEFGPERIELSNDLKTLSIKLVASNPGDQMRVLTAVPTPAAAWAGLGLLASLLGSHVYRRTRE